MTLYRAKNPPNIGGARGDMPPSAKGPSLASGVGPNTQVGDIGSRVGGTAVSNNPALSPTDAMVNRIAEAERAVKNERRSQWLQMNQQSAANVLSSIGGELPSHLKGQEETTTAEFLANAIGSGKDDSANDALFKRMSEVAVRRVARKRGVAVDTPQTKFEGGVLTVNVTYIDDGRVLDTPEDLTSSFEHAISTEVALKGLEAVVEINLFRSKDGAVEKIGDDIAPQSDESDEEMFACEVCDGLVKESDSECPHCGALFEDDEEEPVNSPPVRGGGPQVHQEAVQPDRLVEALPVHRALAAHPRGVDLLAVVPQVVVQAAHPREVDLPEVARQSVAAHRVAVQAARPREVDPREVVLRVVVQAVLQREVDLLAAVQAVLQREVDLQAVGGPPGPKRGGPPGPKRGPPK